MTTNTVSDLALEDFIPAKNVSAEYPGVFNSYHQVYWLIRNRDTNGLAKSGALVRFGKEWVFIKPKFAQFLASKTAVSA